MPESIALASLTLYRGIAVPSRSRDNMVHAIQTNGLSGTEGKWQFSVPVVSRVRGRLEDLFNKADLTREDVLQDTPLRGLCACGTECGAAYYATTHNYSIADNDSPLIIEFDAPISDVYVDCRDFLCTAFQLCDCDEASARHPIDAQLRVLVELFGEAIARYFSAARASSEQSYRIALCNLAAFDPGVVIGHYSNRKVIAGRYRTRFSSAFFVTAPVTPERIRKVYTSPPLPATEADISLDAFLGRSRD